MAPSNDRLDKIVLEAHRNAEQRAQGYREQALKLFPWVCGRCARSFERSNLQLLEVHHKNGNHADNPPDGSNWELLCTYCHEHEHSKLKDMAGRSGNASQAATATFNPFADLKARLAAKKDQQGPPLDPHPPSLDRPDPFDLNRFAEAQAGVFDQALAEIKAGSKRSHWMWFIFPQIAGLGFSATARYYAIKGQEEAKAYLHHPLLGPRLVQCAEAALSVEGRSALEIFGHPDDLKLKSCATLFASISPTAAVFQRLLEKYFQGQMDAKTLQLIGSRDQKKKKPNQR